MNLLIIVLILGTVFSLEPEDFQITKVNNTGVIFEKIGKSILYHHRWQVFTTIKLQDIQESLKTLDCYMQEIAIVCQQLTTRQIRTVCTQLNWDIRHQTDDLFATNSELEQVFKEKRRRRALINAGGRGLKFLFGTMDDTDETNIYKRLERLENNDEATFNLMKQQISVIKSNHDKLVKPINWLMNETEFFTHKINNLETFVKLSANLTYIRQEIVELSNFMLIKIMDIQKTQNTALSILNALKMHRVHPLVITQKQMKTIVREINKQFKMNPYFLNLHHLEQIIHIDYYESPEGLIIKLDIPIPTEDIYETNQVYLLPIQLEDGSKVLINDKTDFILSNEIKMQYILFDNSHYSECKEIIIDFTHTINVCEALQPILINGEHCLVRLLHNPFAEKVNCIYNQITNSYNILTHLRNKNSWLFIADSEQKLLINCGAKETLIIIHGQQIITFGNLCRIKTNDYILPVQGTSSKNIEIKQPLTYANNTEILWNYQNSTNSHNLEIVTPTRLKYKFIEKNDEMDKLEENLKQAAIERSRTENNTNIMYHTVSWGTIMLIVMAISATIYYVHNKFNTTNKTPTVRSTESNVRSTEPIYTQISKNATMKEENQSKEIIEPEVKIQDRKIKAESSNIMTARPPKTTN